MSRNLQLLKRFLDKISGGIISEEYSKNTNLKGRVCQKDSGKEDEIAKDVPQSRKDEILTEMLKLMDTNKNGIGVKSFHAG